MKELQQILTALGVECVPAYPLSKHSSFRIGGAAKFFLSPNSKEKLIKTLNGCYVTFARFDINSATEKLI